MQRFIFPRWTNKFVLLVLATIAIGGATIAGPVLYLGTDPVTLNPGYRPDQPVPFSHALHAGKLKMDCRYCHTSVDKWAHSSVPATKVCINCHSPLSPEGAPVLSAVHPESPKLKAVHDSWRTGQSIDWVRIHNLPDYVYFNHSAHVNRGVSCVSCHGRVDQMEVVYQAENQSMAWCLDCHRNPAPHIRPVEFVTQLDWRAEDIGEDPVELGKRLMAEKHINPHTNCATCHR